ncbi:hypothetical protein HDV04_000483 [Boothiomyces sp. JEL0838]|nr:hypothetical protein HDV04_000483 [Boothiomyces sp. JEL0838]
MSAFINGYGFDGAIDTGLDFTEGISYFAVSLAGFYILLTLIMIVQLGRGWLNYKKSKWQMYGYIVFAVTCVAYETFHAVFIANEVIAQAKLRQKLLNLTNGSVDRKELETFNYLSAVGMAHILFITIVFKEIRSINVKKMKAKTIDATQSEVPVPISVLDT